MSLPAFEETFAFTAWDNTVLTSVSLPALATVTGELYLGSDPLLTSVTLGPVTSVRGLQLYRNDALSDLTPFSGITVVEDLFGIAHCPAVTSLSAFSNLTEMGRLFVEDMSMADFSGFEGITGEIGHLDIRDNPGITSLTGLGGITKTSQVYIAHNDTLASVGELSSLNEVTGDFEISGNTVLPTCAAEALRDQVLAGGGIGGNVDISLNDDGGTCSR